MIAGISMTLLAVALVVAFLWLLHSCLVNPYSAGIAITTMNVDMKVGQFFELDFNPLDRKGNEAPIESGTYLFSTDREDILELVLNGEDESKVKVISKATGSAIVYAQVDADRGEGVRTIEAQVTVNVLEEEAVELGLTATEPQDVENPS